MKLFKTSNIRIVQLCQLRTVPFELPTTCSSSKTIFREVFRLRINAYYAPAPVGEAVALSGDRRPSSVCPSVCLSDVAYIGSNSKTKRPRKTKFCKGVPQVTCDSHTDFKVKRSKVKVGRGHIVAAT